VFSNCFNVLNPNTKSLFLLFVWKIIKHKKYVFCYLNHHFVTAVKVTWKLVSDVCEHMKYLKRVFLNCFHVLNPNIKSFLLLVEWKIIKHETICVLAT